MLQTQMFPPLFFCHPNVSSTGIWILSSMNVCEN